MHFTPTIPVLKFQSISNTGQIHLTFSEQMNTVAVNKLQNATAVNHINETVPVVQVVIQPGYYTNSSMLGLKCTIEAFHP